MSSLTPSAIELLSSVDQELVAEIVEECMIALENGIALDIDTLVAEHPRLEEPLRRCLASLQTLHDVVHGMNDTVPNHRNYEIGGKLGDFHLESVIGRGGMGVVYLATQVSLNRKVALKILPANRFTSPKRLKRFLLEAQSAAQLQHPHIVPVFAVGEDADVYYYAMQWIDGQSLDQCDSTSWARNRFEKLAEVGFDIAMALQNAHDCGIVHRDIKPSNLLLDKQGKVWVADFGLAHRIEDSSLTISGELVGTVNYMSPEQASGSPVDERTDIYSLGATLYELATGHQAFRGNGLQDLLRKIEQDEPIKPRKYTPIMPIDLETILCKAMSKDREDRYTTAQEFAIDLAAFREGRAIRGRPPGLTKILGKLLVRHLPLFGVAIVGLGLSLVILLTCMLQVWNARNATALALNQSQEHLKASQENYWRGRNLLDRWNAKFLPQLAHIPDAAPIRSAMLADTIEYYERYLVALDRGGVDPKLETDRDAARLRLAEAYVQAGDSGRAIANFSTAIKDLSDRYETLDSDAKRNLFVAHNDLGLVYLAEGNSKEAASQLKQSVDGHDWMIRENPSSEEYLANKAAAHLNLAQTYCALRQRDSESKQRALAEQIYRDLVERNSEEADYRSELGVLLDHRAVSLSKSDISEAIQVASEGVQWHRTCAEDGIGRARDWQRLGASLHNLGVLQSQANVVDRCRENLSEAIAIRTKLVKLEPSRRQHNIDLAVSHNAIGAIESMQSNRLDANKHFELAAALLQKSIEESRSETGEGCRIELARTLLNIAKLELQQGNAARLSQLERIELVLNTVQQGTLGSVEQRQLAELQQQLQDLRKASAEVRS